MKLSKAKREALRELPYPKYLRSQFWRSVRQLALKRARNACQLCNAKSRLQVHHRSYQNRGYEDKNIQDLIVLCRTCHNIFHKNKKIISTSKTKRV